MTPLPKMIELLRAGYPCDESGKSCRVRDAQSGCFCAEVADKLDQWKIIADERLRQIDTERAAYASLLADFNHAQ